MITCPKCGNQEVEGALVCSNCGTELAVMDFQTTQSIGGAVPSDVFVSAEGGLDPQDFPPITSEGVEVEVLLNLIDDDTEIILKGSSEYTIGRVTEGQLRKPEVDLSNYEAYARGVSRLHATLKVIHRQIMIVDLGSSNGTRVNGQKIMSHVDCPLSNGDVIALGKLKMQIVIK